MVAPHDPLLRADHLRTLASMYAGADGADDPSINPMRSSLDRLGEVHLFNRTRDVFNPDARVFTAKAASASDTTVVLHEAAAMLHDWMLMPTSGSCCDAAGGRIPAASIDRLCRASLVPAGGIDGACVASGAQLSTQLARSRWPRRRWAASSQPPSGRHQHAGSVS